MDVQVWFCKIYRTNLHKSNLIKLRFASIKNGLEKIYSDASELLTISKKNPNESNLHEWRKSVKDLYHCISVLSPIRPKVYNRYATDLKRLSDLLGELHDYFELQHYTDSTEKKDIDLELINAHIEKSKSRPVILIHSIIALSRSLVLTLSSA